MSVHVIDSGADAPTAAAAGDVLLRRAGDEIEVSKVTASGTEVLGTVPADTIDLDAAPEKLEIAAHGIKTALDDRGA